MRTIEEARRRWDTLFRDHDTTSNLRTTLKSAQGATLCSDGLRSICWKAFLLFDDLDGAQWLHKTSESRSAYDALRSHFLKYIEHPDDLESSIDPLADDEQSPWQTLRHDEQTRTDISQDVDRCLQENFFFREPATKAKMVGILFIYCKLNPDLGYRQGMHELLAPVLWAVDRDAIDVKSAPKSLSGDDELLLQLLDGSYVEHDSFALFCSVMQTARIYYEHGGGGHIEPIPVVTRCQHIQDDLLMSVDPELANHLQALEILPQIFLTRWMRLLFGREFPFEDNLAVWDLLFADGLDPEIVDFVCIAMLLRIRWELLNADHSNTMRMLLRYPSPQPHSPQIFVHDALFLQQNATLEGGSMIISKYSERQPRFFKHLSQPSGRPGSPSKSHPRRGFSDFSSGTESSLPARPPTGNNARSFDSILQDVSQGIQRRTETWSVAKAVRGAVTDARRNMNTMQWEPRRATRSDNIASPRHRDMPRIHEPTVNSKAPVDSLEERNMALAQMLGQASHGLRIHTVSGESLNPAAADAIKQALAKLESVQICLENPSIPLGSMDTPLPEETTAAQKSTDNEQTKEAASRHPKVDKPSTDAPPTNAIPPKTTTSPTKQLNPDPSLQPPTSIPTRPAPRPSLANSEFSWMLGNGNRQASSFASSASDPPEKTRNHDTKAGTKQRHNSLFGNGEDAQSPGVEEADVAMNSLRGRK